ncbi:hypothetical protein ABT297_13730 [Dactylosporangium sp. NPDC000555]|uniref:hypothetical protein n=1 Tax=Dactylosporangium sp. NPDC000555 TaxID=3154260 RepID=UPI003317DEA8
MDRSHTTLTSALASLHADGHVREAAVVAMGDQLRPAHLRFLVQLAVDWVPEVRAAALRVLGTAFGERPALRLPAVRAAAKVIRHKHALCMADLITA